MLKIFLAFVRGAWVSFAYAAFLAVVAVVGSGRHPLMDARKPAL